VGLCIYDSGRAHRGRKHANSRIFELLEVEAEQSRLETEKANLVDFVATGGKAGKFVLTRLVEVEAEIQSLLGKAAVPLAYLAALGFGDIDTADLRREPESFELLH